MKKIIAFLVLGFAITHSQTNYRVCSDRPTGLPSYNPDWYFYEFNIPDQMKIISTYGGFSRTSWYTNAEHDYIAQYFQRDLPPQNLGEYQLWNYDTIGVSMYNREWDVSDLNLFGSGTLRISAPLTHYVTWNEACVTYAPIAQPVEAIPEPSTLILLSLGFVGLVYVNRKQNTTL